MEHTASSQNEQWLVMDPNNGSTFHEQHRQPYHNWLNSQSVDGDFNKACNDAWTNINATTILAPGENGKGPEGPTLSGWNWSDGTAILAEVPRMKALMSSVETGIFRLWEQEETKAKAETRVVMNDQPNGLHALEATEAAMVNDMIAAYTVLDVYSIIECTIMSKKIMTT